MSVAAYITSSHISSVATSNSVSSATPVLSKLNSALRPLSAYVGLRHSRTTARARAARSVPCSARPSPAAPSATSSTRHRTASCDAPTRAAVTPSTTARRGAARVALPTSVTFQPKRGTRAAVTPVTLAGHPAYANRATVTLPGG